VLIERAPLPDATVAEPTVELPSLNEIVPVAEVGVTLAVSEIAWPATAVAGEATRVTAVVCNCAPFTCTDTALDAEAPSAASPAYDAVMLWVPAISDVIVNVAAPLVNDAVPSDVEPSSRVTVPEGVDPADAATTTLKVTDCPTLIWVADAERLVVVVAAGAAAGCTTNMTAE
jgi:hypothetical protein